jgi:S-adenosylmethionine synthetase
MEKICTAEFVTPKHPDKLCDLVADTLLDSYIAGDPSSRVALEVCGGHDLIVINGEVTSTASPEVEKQVKQVVGDRIKHHSNIVNISFRYS